MRSIIIFLMVCLCLPSLADTPRDFRLDSLGVSRYRLCLGADAWPIDFPVYRFETGDVNGDGSIDAIVGVVKSTRFDPVVRRRVFMFKNYKGHVRALWLGSRMGNPIADFHFHASSGMLRVMEHEADGTYLVADYRWQSFGMQFVRYVVRHVSLPQAEVALHDETRDEASR